MSSYEDIVFSNNTIKLTGVLYKPCNEPYPVVVVLHGSHMGEESHFYYEHLKSALPQNGIGAFIYDRRGNGRSEGDFNTASFHDLAQDALAAVNILRKREDVDEGHIGLYGISQGAWVASLAASISDTVSFVVLVSASGISPAKQMLFAASASLNEAGFPAETVNYALDLKQQVDHYFRGLVPREVIEAKLRASCECSWYDKAYLPLQGRLPIDIENTKWFYQLDFDPLEYFSKLSTPILFLFADHDVYVPVEISIENYRIAASKNPEVQFIKIKDADHFMSSPNHHEKRGEFGHISDDYLNHLIKWLRTRLFIFA